MALKMALTALLGQMLATCHKTAFDLRFALRSRNWSAASVRPMPSATSWLVTGFLNEALGIGQAGRLTAERLAGIFPEIEREDLRPLERRLLSRAPTPFPRSAAHGVWLIHANPPEARIALYARQHGAWKDVYRIGYWVWETSVAPLSWVKSARWFHEIWVPSQFAHEAFSRAFERAGEAGQVAKLRVMPHPVASGADRQRDRSGLVTQALVLFDPRSDFERKNPLGAIQAWLQAFPIPSEKARLIVKSHAGCEAHAAYQWLLDAAQGRPDIEFQADTLGAAEMERLIDSCHLLISLHRGEGFGLSLAEGMASRLCVIATGWSGNLQFMSSENAVLVPFALRSANARYNGPVAQWAEPDLAVAASAIRHAVRDEEMRLRLGAQAQKDIGRLSEAWQVLKPPSGMA